jgi:hypothetical protein
VARPGKHRRDSVPIEEREARADAVAADRDASKVLHEAHARSSEVASLARLLRGIRTRNHFGEMVRNALDGK